MTTPTEALEINNYLTCPGVAREIGVSESTVRRYLADGVILMDAYVPYAGIALFKREKLPYIRSQILPQPPATPENCDAIYGRTPRAFPIK